MHYPRDAPPNDTPTTFTKQHYGEVKLASPKQVQDAGAGAGRCSRTELTSRGWFPREFHFKVGQFIGCRRRRLTRTYSAEGERVR